MTDLPARRYKMESEYDDSDRRNVKRFGASRLVERDEYVRARREALQGPDHHDPALRARLMREEAEALAEVAARREQMARERMTPDEWMARDAAKGRGEEPPAMLDEKGEALRQKAAAMRAHADELQAHLGAVEATPDDHLERIQGRR